MITTSPRSLIKIMHESLARIIIHEAVCTVLCDNAPFVLRILERSNTVITIEGGTWQNTLERQ